MPEQAHLARIKRPPSLSQEDDIGTAGTVRQQILDPADQRLHIPDLTDLDDPFEPVRVAVAAHRIGRRKPDHQPRERRWRTLGRAERCPGATRSRRQRRWVIAHARPSLCLVAMIAIALIVMMVVPMPMAVPVYAVAIGASFRVE